MTNLVTIETLYTVEDALRVCARLRQAGIEVDCEQPAFTGNYIVDWNMATPEWSVRVPEEQVMEASALLAEALDDDFHEEPGEAAIAAAPSAVPTVGPDGEEFSRRVDRIYRSSILATLFFPIWFVGCGHSWGWAGLQWIRATRGACASVCCC